MHILSPLMHIVATRLAESAETAMALDATVILHCYWPLVRLMMLLIALQLFPITVPVLS